MGPGYDLRLGITGNERVAKTKGVNEIVRAGAQRETGMRSWVFLNNSGQ